jgi:hypothetical protein
MKATAQQVQRTSTTSTSNTVACRKCKSTQIVANKRGYNFKTLFLMLLLMGGGGVSLVILGTFLAWQLFLKPGEGLELPYEISMVPTAIGYISLFLTLPTAILCGFIGRNTIVNGCMNCGHKWMPAKKK